MKTMTIYALMGKIYNNNQDTPKKIKYGDRIYEWKEYDCGYQEKKKINWVKKCGYVAEVDRTYFYLEHCFKDLHDEVEIIEEDKKITPTAFENLGYALGSIQKYINKGYDKAIEEDKIEKLNKQHFHKRQRQLANKINKLIDVINEMKKGE